MFTLVRGAKLYTPTDQGQCDILIACGKIVDIAPNISLSGFPYPVATLDLHGLIVCPGLIDHHVHLAGGGGEGGPATCTPEAMLSDLTLAGVTTVVGCLGTDGISRSMERLLMKARALETEGLTTFIYTGSYKIPTTTLTGSVERDLMLIDKVIGVGEVAISDHRSSQPAREEIARLAAEARVGGMLGGKGGKVHLHVGDGPRGLTDLFAIVKDTEIPASQFIPTHVNRNSRLLQDAIRFAKMGGFIDITAGEESHGEHVPASEAVWQCLDAGVPLDHITLSSDGNGSLPIFNERKELIGLGIGSAKTLLETIRVLVNKGTDLPAALSLITSNVADIHHLTGKGRLTPGFDADLTILDSQLNVWGTIARGRILVRERKAVVRGTFER